MQLHDLANKWMHRCASVEEVKDKIVLEHLLDAQPPTVQVLVQKRKPSTRVEAATLTDDYMLAHKESYPLNS